MYNIKLRAGLRPLQQTSLRLILFPQATNRNQGMQVRATKSAPRLNKVGKAILSVLIFLLLNACRLSSRTLPLGEDNFTLRLGPEGDQREVILHLPPAYDGSTQLPLLIVLHGGGGNGEQVERQSGMDSYADKFGFVVAYPNGSGRLEDAILTWNSGHCCGYALSHNIDDVSFLRSLIDSLVSEYAIDPSRVYMTGMSNGAMMAYRAGAELADKIAGIAPIAGSIGGQARVKYPAVFLESPAEPISVIAFHGMRDQHVPYDGGIGPEAITQGRIDFSVERSISFWLSADSCDPDPATESQANGNIIIDTYSGCEAGTAVVLVTIVDGLHAWPGGVRALLDEPTQDISASEMMLEFFLAHPKQ